MRPALDKVVAQEELHRKRPHRVKLVLYILRRN